MNSSGLYHYTTCQVEDLLLSLIVQTLKRGARPAYAGKNQTKPTNQVQEFWKPRLIKKSCLFLSQFPQFDPRPAYAGKAPIHFQKSLCLIRKYSSLRRQPNRHLDTVLKSKGKHLDVYANNVVTFLPCHVTQKIIEIPLRLKVFQV